MCTAGGSMVMVQWLNAIALLAATDDPNANNFAHAVECALPHTDIKTFELMLSRTTCNLYPKLANETARTQRSGDSDPARQ